MGGIAVSSSSPLGPTWAYALFSRLVRPPSRLSRPLPLLLPLLLPPPLLLLPPLPPLLLVWIAFPQNLYNFSGGSRQKGTFPCSEPSWALLAEYGLRTGHCLARARFAPTALPPAPFFARLPIPS